MAITSAFAPAHFCTAPLSCVFPQHGPVNCMHPSCCPSLQNPWPAPLLPRGSVPPPLYTQLRRSACVLPADRLQGGCLGLPQSLPCQTVSQNPLQAIKTIQSACLCRWVCLSFPCDILPPPPPPPPPPARARARLIPLPPLCACRHLLSQCRAPHVFLQQQV